MICHINIVLLENRLNFSFTPTCVINKTRWIIIFAIEKYGDEKMRKFDRKVILLMFQFSNE